MSICVLASPFTLIVIDFAFDFGFGAKVEQQANLNRCGFEIVEQLRFVLVGQLSDGFEFDNDGAIHKKVS